MKTKSLLFAIAFALPAAAVAQTAPSEEKTYRQSVHERYCAKLREGPEAYTQFVHAKRTVLGYTYTDFARMDPGDPVKFDCNLPAQPVADAKAPEKTPTKVAEKPDTTR